MELLHDSEVFTDSSLEIMKRLKDYGGQTTCSQLATKYGESHNFYNSGSKALARRVADKTGCHVMSMEDGNIKWWSILYVGRNADKDDEGVFIWKLRDELTAALDRFDLSNVDLYVTAPDDSDCRYWWLNANPKIWSFADLKVGEAQSYTLYNDNGNKRRIFSAFSQCQSRRSADDRRFYYNIFFYKIAHIIYKWTFRTQTKRINPEISEHKTDEVV